jgi:hypothetical protein
LQLVAQGAQVTLRKLPLFPQRANLARNPSLDTFGHERVAVLSIFQFSDKAISPRERRASPEDRK